MNILDNSMYTTSVDEPLLHIPVNPVEEELESKIMMKKDEEQENNNSFEDIEAIRTKVIQKWEMK